MAWQASGTRCSLQVTLQLPLSPQTQGTQTKMGTGRDQGGAQAGLLFGTFSQANRLELASVVPKRGAQVPMRPGIPSSPRFTFGHSSAQANCTSTFGKVNSHAADIAPLLRFAPSFHGHYLFPIESEFACLAFVGGSKVAEPRARDAGLLFPHHPALRN